MLIDLLGEASASYLVRQFEAGVDAADFRHLGGSSAGRRVSQNGASSPLPVLLQRSASRFLAHESSASPAALGPNLRSISKRWQSMRSGSIGRWSSASRAIGSGAPAGQGNLDPLALLTGGAPLDRSVDAILEALAGDRSFSISATASTPETPIAHVERLIERCAQGRGLRPTSAVGGRRTPYEWIKAFHIIAVIAPDGGMLYLPRRLSITARPRRIRSSRKRSRSWNGGCYAASSIRR